MSFALSTIPNHWIWCNQIHRSWNLTDLTDNRDLQEILVVMSEIIFWLKKIHDSNCLSIKAKGDCLLTHKFTFPARPQLPKRHPATPSPMARPKIGWIRRRASSKATLTTLKRSCCHSQTASTLGSITLRDRKWWNWVYRTWSRSFLRRYVFCHITHMWLPSSL